MHTNKTFTKALACFLALVMVFGAFASINGATVPAAAAEGMRSGVDNSYTQGNNENAVLTKTAELTEDGTYRIDLSAFTKGDVVVEAEPMDIILLLDQSYSMADRGEYNGRYYDCNHTTAVRQAVTALIDRVHEQAVQYNVEHRMAIAAYGCENSMIAQEEAHKVPYTGSEVYVGANAYGFSGRSSVFGVDVVYRRNKNTGEVIRTVGNSHYHYNASTYFNELDAGGNYKNYPPYTAQAHYDDCMLSLKTQADSLKASLTTYNPDKADSSLTAGTAMQVGMKMVEGILDAYRPNAETHENMYRVGDEWKNRKKIVIIFTDGYVGDSAFNPDWANECVKSSFRMKGDTYGEPATVYTVGLVYEKMNDYIYNDLKPYAPYGDYYDTYGYFGDRYVDGGLWRADASDTYVTYTFRGELFPRYYYTGDGQNQDPHHGLLNTYLSYISSNYIPQQGGPLPTLGVLHYYEDDRDFTDQFGTTHIHNMQLHVTDLSAWWNTALTPNYTPEQGNPGIIKNNYYIDTNNALDEASANGQLNIARLVDAFDLITTETTTVTRELLDVNAVLRDALSEHFKMPEDFGLDNISVKVVPFTGSVVNGEYVFNESEAYDLFTNQADKAANVRFDRASGVVTVSGYNYAQCIAGRTGGSKLVVTLTGIEARPAAVGDDLPTNDPDQTGIYEGTDLWDPIATPVDPGHTGDPGDPSETPDRDPLLYFPLPKVDIREKYVVYDFCRPVEEDNPEYFFGENGDVVELLALGECYKKQNPNAYQERYVKHDASGDKLYIAQKHNGNGARFEIKQISYDDFEIGALLECDPNKNDGVRYEWCKLTFLPATNVHYEETMLRYSSGDAQDAIDNNYAHWMELGGVNCSWQRGGGGSVAAQQSAANLLYGYEASYDRYGNSGNSDSSGSAAHAVVDAEYAQQVKDGVKQWPTAHFRYTGTGFDVISRSGANTGVLAVDVVPYGAPRNYKQGVKNKDYAHLIVDTYYKDAGDGEAVILHQIPVLRIVDMNWADYDVYITAVYDKLFDHLPKPKGVQSDETSLDGLKIPGLPEAEYELTRVAPEGTPGESIEPSKAAPAYGSFDVYLDAVRVYEPRTKTGITAIDRLAYQAANEYNPTYRQIRDILLDPAQYEGGNVNIDGVLYIDGQGGIVNVEKYEAHGPNNETYLAPAEKHSDGTSTERAFAFTIKEWDNEKSGLHISAKAPYGTVHLHVNGEHVAVVKSATEMYYDVTDIIRRTNGLIHGENTPNGHVVIQAYLDPNGPDPVVTAAPPTLAPGQTATPESSETPYAAPDPATHNVLSLVNIKFIPEQDAVLPDPTPTPDPTPVPDPTPTPAENYHLVIFADADENGTPGAVVKEVWVRNGDQLVEGLELPDFGENGVYFYDDEEGRILFTWPTVPAAPAGLINNVNNGYGGWNYNNEPINGDRTIYPARESASLDKARVTFTVNGNPNMQLLISSDLTTNTIPAGSSFAVDRTSVHNAMSADNLPYMLPGPTKDDVYTDMYPNGEVEVEPGTYRFGVFSKIDMGTRTYWYLAPGVAEVTLAAGDTLHVTFNTDTGCEYRHVSGANPIVVSTAHNGEGAPVTYGSIAHSVRGETDESDCVAFVSSDTFLFAEALLVGKPGDANHDREIDLMDALLIMRHALGEDCGFDLYELYCADLNKDGAIDLLDAVAVMRASLITE